MKSPILNELSPETKMSAFKKAAAYTRKPGEITNKVLYNKRKSQEYTFAKHVSPQLQAQADTIAKLIGSEFIASIDKGIYGSEEIPAISIKFYEPTNKQSNATLLVSAGSGYNAGDISTDLKLNNIELSEPVQRKLVRFADAVYKSEISSNLKENHNINNKMKTNEGTFEGNSIAVYDGENGLTQIYKRGNGYYGINDDFDFHFESKAELEMMLKKWRYRLIAGGLKENKMKTNELKSLIKECYKEVLAEGFDDQEAELPATRSVNMGDAPSKIDLGVDNKASGKISKLQSAIDQLSTVLKTNLDLYKAGKMSIADYKTAVGDIPMKLKSLVAALEAEIGKTANI